MAVSGGGLSLLVLAKTKRVTMHISPYKTMFKYNITHLQKQIDYVLLVNTYRVQYHMHLDCCNSTLDHWICPRCTIHIMVVLMAGNKAAILYLRTLTPYTLLQRTNRSYRDRFREYACVVSLVIDQ